MRSRQRAFLVGIALFGLSSTTALHASVTAVISTPPDTQHLANYTFEQFSAFDSTFSGNDTEIVHCYWEFGDGSTDIGFQVAHKYAAVTTYTVKLTVYGDYGSSNYTTTTVTTADPNFQQTWYVDSINGSNNNTGLTSSLPVATLAYAVSLENTWALSNGGSTHAGLWTRIRLHCGQDFPVASNEVIVPGGNGWAACVIDTWNNGSRPTITLPSPSGGHYEIVSNASSGWPSAYGYSIYWKNLVFRWPAEIDGNRIENHIFGGQFDNVDLVYGSIELEGTKELVYSATITGAYERGVYSSGDWKMLLNSSISACGNNWVTHHQAYFSKGDYYGIRDCVLDGTAVACDSGLKTSGGQRFYVADNHVIGTLMGFDTGSNNDGSDRVGQDAVFERNHIKNVGNATQGVSVGFWMSWVSRYRFYNNVIEGIGGYPQHDVFHIATTLHSGNQTTVSDVKIRHNTIYDCDVSALGMDATVYWTNVVFENNIIHEASTTNYLIQVGVNGSTAQLTCDGNCYFRTGAVATSAGLFYDGTSSRSFTQWKSSDGFDTHGEFADPQFTNTSTSDFRLLSTSPCVDAAYYASALRPVYLDYLKVVRPLGAGYDQGALESH